MINQFMLISFIIYLIYISIIDIKTKEIEDELILLGLFISMWYAAYNTQLLNNIPGMLTGFIIFLLIAIITNAMGGADIKIMAIIGLMFGVKGALFITLLSFFSGSIISIIFLLLKNKKCKEEIAFIPFITFATITYVLFGNTLILYYLSLFN